MKALLHLPPKPANLHHYCRHHQYDKPTKMQVQKRNKETINVSLIVHVPFIYKFVYIIVANLQKRCLLKYVHIYYLLSMTECNQLSLRL